MATLSPTPEGQWAWLELDSDHFYNCVVLLRLLSQYYCNVGCGISCVSFSIPDLAASLNSQSERAVQDASLTTQMYSQLGFYFFIGFHNWLTLAIISSCVVLWSGTVWLFERLIVFNSVLTPPICCLWFWTTKTCQKTNPTINNHMVTEYSIAISVYTVKAYD